MKRFIAALFMLAALCAASASVLAQPKVGYVDVDRVLRESKAAQQAQKAIETEFAPRDRELARLADKVTKMKTELEKDSASLGELERQKRERALGDANLDLQRKQRDFSEDLNQRRNDELATVLARAGDAVKQVAEAENIDIVFKEAVWINPAINITDKVIKALDEAHARTAR